MADPTPSPGARAVAEWEENIPYPYRASLPSRAELVRRIDAHVAAAVAQAKEWDCIIIPDREPERTLLALKDEAVAQARMEEREACCRLLCHECFLQRPHTHPCAAATLRAREEDR